MEPTDWNSPDAIIMEREELEARTRREEAGLVGPVDRAASLAPSVGRVAELLLGEGLHPEAMTRRALLLGRPLGLWPELAGRRALLGDSGRRARLELVLGVSGREVARAEGMIERAARAMVRRARCEGFSGFARFEWVSPFEGPGADPGVVEAARVLLGEAVGERAIGPGLRWLSTYLWALPGIRERLMLSAEEAEMAGLWDERRASFSNRVCQIKKKHPELGVPGTRGWEYQDAARERAAGNKSREREGA